MNLTTVITIHLIFICARIYDSEVTADYEYISVNNFLAIGVHMVLAINIGYSYIMLFLQVGSRLR